MLFCEHQDFPQFRKVRLSSALWVLAYGGPQILCFKTLWFVASPQIGLWGRAETVTPPRVTRWHQTPQPTSFRIPSSPRIGSAHLTTFITQDLGWGVLYVCGVCFLIFKLFLIKTKHLIGN